MTRTMYDGVDASRLPTSAQLVGGYVDGLYAWSADDWARFPNSVKVRIAVFADTNDGEVLDCEPGNCTPAESVDWVLMRRRAGVDPTVYCNQMDPDTGWPAVRAAFAARNVAEPRYWVAHYDGAETIPPGAVAKQHTNDEQAGWDLSAVADYWPGIDPAPTGASNIALSVQEDDMPESIKPLAEVPHGEYVYPFAKGTRREVAFVTDTFGGAPAKLRVVVWTTAGPSVHDAVTVPSGSTVLAFGNPGSTYAVTVRREDSGPHPVGVCVV